ncbi:hypothetical protein DPMN_126238 [Dreissena polymorpha]|uniref:Uncharacterized protein n=1 Tax=Dreissena polymorpha TaxID=45954 RepID=A0A9D4H2Z0_DREPO|nr:hypothetical protein DPMN_126238 [Dreissena polymorpha]
MPCLKKQYYTFTKYAHVSLQKQERNEFAEEYEDVGYRLFLILARMTDIDPKLMDTCTYIH